MMSVEQISQNDVYKIIENFRSYLSFLTNLQEQGLADAEEFRKEGYNFFTFFGFGFKPLYVGFNIIFTYPFFGI